MNTVDAVYSNGVFKPLGDVSLSENQKVRLTIDATPPERVQEWLRNLRAFHEEVLDRRGILPDSTPEIALDRRRHE